MRKKHILPNGLAVYGGLGLLLLLGLAAFLFRQDFSDGERRYLAKPPQNYDLVRWTLNEDVENYLSDQIPFRRALVNIHSAGQVLTGRAAQLDAWPVWTGGPLPRFIEKPVQGTERELNSRVQALESLAGDIPHWFLTPPTVGSLLRNAMSGPRRAVYDADAALYQMLFERRDSAIGKDALADFAVSGAAPYFYGTDHHWNISGAWLAYQSYCRAAGLQAADEADFTWVKGDDAPLFLGTTYSRSGLPFASPDRLEYAEPKDPVTLRILDGDTVYDHLIFPEEAETYDGYAIFLKGNHGLLEIESPAAPDRTLFVCKDSFANCILPFLTKNYRRIVAADARYYSGTLNEALEIAGDVDEILFLYSLDSLATDTAILRKIRK